MGVVLLQSDQDLVKLKETVDGLTETQAKERLMVAAASGAQEYIEMRQGADLN